MVPLGDEPAAADGLLGIDEVAGVEEAEIDGAAEDSAQCRHQVQPILDRDRTGSPYQDRDIDIAVAAESVLGSRSEKIGSLHGGVAEKDFACLPDRVVRK